MHLPSPQSQQPTATAALDVTPPQSHQHVAEECSWQPPPGIHLAHYTVHCSHLAPTQYYRFAHGSLRSSGLVLSQQMLATQAAAAASQAHWSAVAQYHAQSTAMLLSWSRSQPGLLKTKSTTPLAASTIHGAVVGGCMTPAPTQLRCFSTQPGERKRRTGSVCLAVCVALLACCEEGRTIVVNVAGWCVATLLSLTAGTAKYLYQNKLDGDVRVSVSCFKNRVVEEVQLVADRVSLAPL